MRSAKQRAHTYFSDPLTFERVPGSLPCGCGHELATVEKHGRCVGPNCAATLNGREFPLRRGNQTSSLVSYRKRETVV